MLSFVVKDEFQIVMFETGKSRYYVTIYDQFYLTLTTNVLSYRNQSVGHHGNIGR